MRKYIYHFDTESDFNEMRSAENYDEPWLSLTEYNLDENIPVTDVARVDYNKTEREKLLETPLTFEIQSDGNIRWQKQSTSAPTRTIEYSKDNGETWTSITSATGDTAPSISVVSGDTVQFRGNNSSYGTSNSYYNSFAGSTCSFSVKGNIMSLINSTDFPALTSFSGSYNLVSFFEGCTGLTDASKLLLPATTLTDSCYSYIFNGCTSLTQAPELPATTLANDCYSSIFRGCTSLTQAPELPATTLANDCYSYMFYDCTSLAQAPELPATTLANYCYQYMFRDCTNLTQAPELPATTLAERCYYYMFQSCSGLITGPSNIGTSATTMMPDSACTGMFQSCTSLTGAPELPVTTLAGGCYYYMFQDCTSLVNAPELPATTLVDSCYRQMFRDCTNLKYIKCLATDISANRCTYNWVNGVQTNSGTFVKNPNMTSWTTGNTGIPSGWSVQDAS